MHKTAVVLAGLAGFGVPLAGHAQTGPAGPEPSRVALRVPGGAIMPPHVDFAIRRDIVDAALAPFNIDIRSYESQLVEAKNGFTQQDWDEFASIVGPQKTLQCHADLYGRPHCHPCDRPGKPA